MSEKKYYLTSNEIFSGLEVDIWDEYNVCVMHLCGNPDQPARFVVHNEYIEACTIAESSSINELIGIAAMECL